MYSISDTTELALRKSCRYRRRLVAWAWLSTRRRGWDDVLAPIALFPAQPPPACCSSGFRVPNHVRGGHDYGLFLRLLTHHVVEAQAPLPCAIVGMNGRHGGSLPDLVRGRVRVRIHAAPQCVRAAAVELVTAAVLYEYHLICSNCAA